MVAHRPAPDGAPPTPTQAAAPLPAGRPLVSPAWQTITQLSLLDWKPPAPRPPSAAEAERRICLERDRLAAQLADPQTPEPWRPRIQAAYDAACWRLVTPWQRRLAGVAGRYAARSRRSADALQMTPYTADELHSHALEEAYKAARRYDPARGIRFSTYMRARVASRLRDLCAWRLSHQRAGGRLERLDAPIADGCACDLVHAVAADPSRPTPEQDLLGHLAAPAARRRLAALLTRASLTGPEREVLELHHGLSADGRADPLTFRQIAEEIGCSKSQAHNLHTRAMRKLRALL